MRMGGTASSLWVGVHLAGCLAAGGSKGLEPRCRPLEFVWRFSGFPDYGIGLLLKRPRRPHTGTWWELSNVARGVVPDGNESVSDRWPCQSVRGRRFRA